MESLWGTVLSAGRVKARHRLDAYKRLEEAGALRRCVCAPELTSFEYPPPAPEITAYTRTIRLLVRRTRRSALVVVRFPETYHALREVLDRKILAAAAESVVFVSDDATLG
jgi:hypothetical protein